MTKPIEIDVWQGDIAQLEMDAIVVPSNESLFMTAPAAAAVQRLAGERVQIEAVAAAPVAPGSVVVTTGGLLPTPYLLHAVAVGHDRRGDERILAATLDTVLDRAEALGVTRLAVPLLGAEHGAIAADVAATAVVAALERHAARPSRALGSVVIVAASAAEMTAIGQALAHSGATSG